MMDGLSPAVVETLDEQPASHTFVSTDGQRVAIVRRRASSRRSIVGRPSVLIGGQRVDPRTYGPHRQPTGYAITITDLRGGEPRDVPIGDAEAVAPIGFSHDGDRFAFATFHRERIELAWFNWLTRETGVLKAHRLNGTGLVLGFGAAAWMGTRLLCRLIPDMGSGSEDDFEADAPLVYDTANGDGAMRWWGGLLETTADERRLRRYCTSQLASVDPLTGDVRTIGDPDLFAQVTPSPDGSYLFVQRIEPPFARPGALGALATSAEIWDAQSGTVVRRLWDAHNRSSRSRATRCWGWSPVEPARLALSEPAPDAGERVLTLSAPFDGDALEVLRTRDRRVIDWTTAGRLLAREYDHSRMLTRMRIPHRSGLDGVVIWQGRLAGDDQLMPLSLKTPGTRAIVERDDAFFMMGITAGDGYARPFLDRIELETGQRSRVFESDADCHEGVVAVLDERARWLLTQREGPRLRIHTCVVDARTGDRRPLEEPVAGVSTISGAERDWLTYRLGNATRSATVYRPHAQRGDGPLPLMLWLYPGVEGDDFRHEPIAIWRNQFIRRKPPSPFVLLDRGCAVVDSPSMALDGAGDTVVEELVENIGALVATLVDRGIADPRRIGVGGFCLGGWVAAMLLAHTDFFCTGVLCTGYYDITSRPLGALMSGRRRYWDVPDVFIERSPLLRADRIKAPVLLIHCEEEGAALDRKDESRRLFAALAALGTEARYVRVPHDGHYYEARESQMLVAREMLAWCDRHMTARSEETADAAVGSAQ